MIRSWYVLVAATLALLCLPAGALAAQTTVSYSSSLNRLLVAGESDDRNDISITQSGSTYTITEIGVYGLNDNDITLNESVAGATCDKPADAVVCTIPGLALLEVRLFRGDDLLDAGDTLSATPVPVATDMLVSTTDSLGDDTDDLITGNGDDTVTTAFGDDFIVTNGGNDTVNGQEGDDDVDAGDGDDIIDGGEDDGADTSDEFDTLVGGLGNDTLIGGPGDDDLSGDEGDDTYVADAGVDGSDTINEFDGNDTADYSARTGIVWLSNDIVADDGTSLPAGEDGLGFFDDIPDEVETLVGGSGNDKLTGVGTGDPAVANVLRGNGGNDALIGTAGTNPDTADYTDAPGAVTVDLAGETATGADGSDSFAEIENATGGSSADSLTGSPMDNVLTGNGGDDSLSGAGGNDTASYATASSGVSVNLATAGAQNTGGAGSDTLSGMENLTGSGDNDNLTGDGSANVIAGLDGSDTLSGANGADSLLGGAGADTVTSIDSPALSDTLIDCGDDSDVLFADPDPFDPAPTACETVNRSAVPPPPAPTLTEVIPAGPANDNNPEVKGTTAVGTTVTIYPSGDCSDTALVTDGARATFEGAGLTVSVANDSTTEFSARAKDTTTLLSSGCSQTTVSFVEDSTAPIAGIDSGPTGETNDPTPTFSFSSGDSTATFQCRVDGGDFAGCSSPATTAELADGPHTFEVKGTDPAGNAGPSASQAFTVKRDPPPPPPPPSPAPPVGGGSGGSGGGGGSVSDATAPKMALAAKRVKASKKGTVKLLISCPASEQSGCSGSVSLGKKLQKGSAKFKRVAAGKKAAVTIKLTSAAKKKLKKKKKLAATAKIVARDDAGNSATTTAKLTIKK